MDYYLGIDGGGTKSRIMAADENENVIGIGFGGSTNINSNAREIVLENLRELFNSLIEEYGLIKSDCKAIAIGSAGLDSDASIEIMETMIRSLGFFCKIIAVNDSQLVLSAATRMNAGITVISGTGAIAYGTKGNGKSIRVGGWGPMFDDGGSAYWIGKEALKAVFYAYDGRGDKTVLTDYLIKYFDIEEVPDCIDVIYNDFNKSEVAKLAIEVTRGAKAGDLVCKRILAEAAIELSLLVETCTKRLGIPDGLDVYVSGGTFMNSDELFNAFSARVIRKFPAVRVLKIDKEPVFGAIYLAMSL